MRIPTIDDVKNALPTASEDDVKMVFGYLLRIGTSKSLPEISRICECPRSVVISRVKRCQKEIADNPDGPIARAAAMLLEQMTEKSAETEESGVVTAGLIQRVAAIGEELQALANDLRKVRSELAER